MDVMIPPRSLVVFFVAVVFTSVALCGAPQVKTDVVPAGFPISLWEKQKEVTQIQWYFDVTKPSVRFDLRQELSLSGWIRDEKLFKTGEHRNLVLYVRAMEQGQPAGSVYSKPISFPPELISAKAIVRPGKYRLEVALIDRETGRYNVQFKNVTIEGDENPVERAFGSFDKFEFVPEPRREPPEPPRPPSLEEIRELANRMRIGMLGGHVSRSSVLKGSDLGYTEDRPSFVINKSAVTHVSVITILSPPEEIVAQPDIVGSFRLYLSNLLSVITRLEVPNGTAKFTGVDLEERRRVFNQIDLKDVTSEMLEHAMKKDTRTVTLDALAGRADQGTFFRDVLRERLTAAENDTSGARQVILVVAALSNFPNDSGLKLSPVRDCHCQVFHLRFTLGPNSSDDIDDMLKAYKPQVFEPLTWEEFREDFGKIYGQLLR
jgi:hypothetical protein